MDRKCAGIGRDTTRLSENKAFDPPILVPRYTVRFLDEIVRYKFRICFIVAAVSGVLTAFYSGDPNSMGNLFDGNFFDDPKEIEGLREKMGREELFDPADALKSGRALRGHLRGSPRK